MNLPQSVKLVIDNLNSNGFSAYVVGGCVRDMVLNKTPHDYDACTNALPEQVLALFKGENTYAIPTGLQHGTVTVVVDGEHIEVTTFRVDGEYSDSRHPDSVAFTDKVEDDLSRRDFTMNAIAYHADNFVDPFGGVDDIKKGIIRCVGDAQKRFNEDPLRILRALRFSAVLGFEIEAETLRWANILKYKLSAIANERKAVELMKLICGEHFANVMHKHREIIAVVLPEIEPMFDFQQNSKYHYLDVYSHTVEAMKGIAPQPYLRWAMLFHDSGKPHCYTEKDGVGHFYGHPKVSVELAKTALKRLKLDNETIDKVKVLIKYHDSPLLDDTKQIKRWLNKLGFELFLDLISVHIADDSGKHENYRGRIARYRLIAQKATEINDSACYSLKHLAINGNDVMALGFEGRAIGEALSLALDMVLNEEIDNEKAALLKMLQNKRA